MGNRQRERRNVWPEWLASLVAFTGLLIAMLAGFSAHTRQNAGSDFKTLYASAWCFARGYDAYSFPNLDRVFRLYQVIPPQSWYAHAPVYPPFTLALLAPLTLLPMVPALYLWIVASAAALAAAVATLAQYSADAFALPRSWRLLLIALAAGSPLVSFALELGNVSVLVTALCLLALLPSRPETLWPPLLLALALLLKPHLSLWMVVALALSRRRGDQTLARRSAAFAFSGALLFGAASLLHGLHGLQWQGYRLMVAAEVSGGSMSPGNRQPMEAAAQITSLRSLLGFWLPTGRAAGIVCIAVLLCLAAALLWCSRRLHSTSEASRLALVTSWIAFGMIATYHRAHDGMLLLLLLPAAFARLRSTMRDPVSWGLLLLLAAMSVDLQSVLSPLANSTSSMHSAMQLALYRQASLAAALMMLLQLILFLHHALEGPSTLSAQRHLDPTAST